MESRREDIELRRGVGGCRVKARKLRGKRVDTEGRLVEHDGS
jgi:hypothetical protein